MTTSAEQEASNIILPLLNIAAAAGVPAQITQGSVATSTSSARLDLSSLSALGRGHFITLSADGASGEDIYVAFTTSDAGAIDETAAGFGVTQCQRITAGSSISGRLPGIDSPSGAAYTWLIHKAKSGTPKLRIAITSICPNEDVRSLRA